MTTEEKNEGQNPDEAVEAAAADDGDTAAKDPDQMSEAELREMLEKQFREQKVSDMLVQYMAGLSHIAYVKMGLTDDTRAVKDMAQSSLAIDSFKALLDAVRDRLDPQDASALEGALASMQLTFAQAGGGPGTGDKETAADDDKPAGGASSRIWVPGQD